MKRGHVQMSRRVWDMPTGCQNGHLADHVCADPQGVQDASHREKGADTSITPAPLPWLPSLACGAGSKKPRPLKPGCLDGPLLPQVSVFLSL